ncbi:10038_t:CDS:2, partial [Cetraspora pellucida]
MQDFDIDSIHSKSCLVSSKSSYISDDGFVVLDKKCSDCKEKKCICVRLNNIIPNYITKQNAFLTNGVSIYKDEELRMDDNLSLYKETLEKMKKNGFSVDALFTQVCAEIKINKNLLNENKDNISKFEKNICNFSLLIIVNEDKKVWISQ